MASKKFVSNSDNTLSLRKEQINTVYIAHDVITGILSLMIKTIFAFDLVFQAGAHDEMLKAKEVLLEELES